MPAVRKFFRLSSVGGLQDYFKWAGIPVSDVEWTRERPVINKQLLEHINNISNEHKVRLRIDAERITHMSDEVGQTALLGTVSDKTTFSSRLSTIDRSSWVFINEPDNFRHAEDVRYADQRRHGRSWKNYGVPPGTPPALDEVSLEAFRHKIKGLFGLGGKVKVDVFERTLPDDNGEPIQVVQLMVYQEHLPVADLEFNGEDDLIARVRRPVAEHAITYAKKTGVIEIVAAKKEHRDAIAEAVTQHLLQRPVTADTLPLRRYDLTPLMEDRPLEWDPGDGIESVRVMMMKLVDQDSQGHFTVEVPAFNKTVKLHDVMKARLKASGARHLEPFLPLKARITVHFKRENGARQQRVLPVTIGLPHSCDLRNRTERERLIGEKYLKRWGLLKEAQV